MNFGVFDLINLEKGRRPTKVLLVMEATSNLTGASQGLRKLYSDAEIASYVKYYTRVPGKWSLAVLEDYRHIRTQEAFKKQVALHNDKAVDPKNTQTAAALEQARAGKATLVAEFAAAREREAARAKTRIEVPPTHTKLVLDVPHAPLTELHGQALAEQKVVTEAAVAAARAKADDVRTDYLRPGDRYKALDPDGWAMAVELRKKQRAIDDLKEKIAGAPTGPKAPRNEVALVEERRRALAPLQKEADELRAKFLARKFAGPIARIVAVQDEISTLQKKGRAWIKQNPKAWEAHVSKFKKTEEKREAEAKAAKKMFVAAAEPQYPPDIAEAIRQLSWKLKGVKGKTVAVDRNLPAVGSKTENLFIAESPDINGLAASDHPISYRLSAGWPVQAQGANTINEASYSALMKEFTGDIYRIVNGGGFGGHAKGWAKQLAMQDNGEELKAVLYTKLWQIARSYLPAKAKESRGMGSHFRVYALNALSNEARTFIRELSRDDKRSKLVDPALLAEVEPMISEKWNEEGATTRDQLWDYGAIATNYASPEDIVAVKDLTRILNSKLGPVEGIALLSFLNLHNPSKKGGFKTWNEVAKDVQGVQMARRRRFLERPEMKEWFAKNPGKTLADYSPLMNSYLGVSHELDLADRLENQLGEAFKTGNLLSGGWARKLLPDDRHGLTEGLKALHRIMEKRILPGVPSYRVIEAPTPAAKHKHGKPGKSVEVPLHMEAHRIIPRRKIDVAAISTRLERVKAAHAKETNQKRKVKLAKLSDALQMRIHTAGIQRKMDLRLVPISPISATGKIEIPKTVRTPNMEHVLHTEHDAYRFFQEQKRPTAAFDPAGPRMLDLGFDDPSAQTGSVVTANTVLKQAKATGLMNAWKQLAKVGPKTLSTLASSPAFKRYKEAWDKRAKAFEASASAAPASEVADARPVHRTKPPRLVIHGVTFERIAPSDLERIAGFITQQRKIDLHQPSLVKKALVVTDELAMLFRKTRRLLKVA